jgi:hypothetical protein
MSFFERDRSRFSISDCTRGAGMAIYKQVGATGEGGTQLCGSSESMDSYVLGQLRIQRSTWQSFFDWRCACNNVVRSTGKLVSCVAKAYHHDAGPRPESIACAIHPS